MTDKLTINIGLRYELSLPWVDVFDKISNLDVDTDLNKPRFIVVGEGGSGRFNRALVQSDTNNFAPRIGFAYRWREDTVFRGGFGLFYANTMNTGGGEFMETNPPSHVKTQIDTDRITPTISLQAGQGAGALAPENSPPLVPGSFEIDAPWPVAIQWNFNIQKQLPNNTLFEIGYFGTKGTHIIRRYNLNYALPGPGSPNSRRRFQTVRFPGTDVDVGLSFLHNFRNDSNSNYHALQTKVEKRFGSGLSYLMSYTWSKAIGDYSFIPGEDRNLGANWGVQNALDLAAERSLLNQHIKHRLVASYLYDLPFGKGRRYGSGWGGAMNTLLGGWTVGGISSFLTGSPINLSVRGNPSNTGGFKPGTGPRSSASGRSTTRGPTAGSIPARSRGTIRSRSVTPAETSWKRRARSSSTWRCTRTSRRPRKYGFSSGPSRLMPSTIRSSMGRTTRSATATSGSSRTRRPAG